MSTMSRWSIQKSSTSSRVTSRKAPPSWMVRDPTSTAPGCLRLSRMRPPGTYSRSTARCGSVFSDNMFTLMPLVSLRCTMPRFCAACLSFKALPSSGIHWGLVIFTFSCSRSLGMSVLGTIESSNGSSGSCMASSTADAISASDTEKFVPFLSMSGAQAMRATGLTPFSGCMCERCSHSSRAMACTSSRVMDVSAFSAARYRS
mmetsp:Transcript_23495/g.33633  ORF Transcript_23495/g.33633 Transcript_23495/m.33633 type:complete len:203 (-) Transcript_23495:18-626(-)